MEYMVENNVPDPYDTGSNDISSYIIVNTAGYYRLNDTSEGSPTVINRPNGRRDFVLCYISEGEMEVTVNKERRTVSEGFFLFPPHMKTNYNNENYRGRFAIYWVHFTGFLVSDALKACGIEGKYIFRTGKIDEVPLLFESMTREMTLKKPGYEAVCASILMYILALLGRKAAMLSMPGSFQIDTRIQRALDFIHIYYGSKTSVAELASIVGLSTSRFSALFREFTGVFPQKYIIRYRTERACELMRHTDFPINQIAAVVGFDDPFYFSRIFKKQTGMSPTEFAKHAKGDIFSIGTTDY